jgi:hypothetical protein
VPPLSGAVRAHVPRPRATIWTASSGMEVRTGSAPEVSCGPSPSSPRPSLPQHQTLRSRRSAQVCC